MPGISAATRLFVLLGDPVSHSLSPRMQNAAFAAAGLDAVYVALPCATDHVAGLVRGVARGGGGGNVTVPHKGVAAAAVEEPTPVVVRTGACNTFWLEEGRIRGDNTDVSAFLSQARALVPDLAGARVLVLGAGGAARAVVAGLEEAAAGEVVLRNRSLVRADALAAAFAAASTHVRVVAPDDPLRGERFDLVVNATSLGLKPTDALPFDLTALAHAGAVLDLAYAPGGTAWVAAARAAGLPGADGAGMLVAQGAAAFERWWAQPAPLEVMRAAVTST